MILIKSGGSVITDKNKPITPRCKNISRIVNILAKIDEPIILVHGGGSFGHYWSVKYDMHTKPAVVNNFGVSLVKESMITLNKIILKEFLSKKLATYPIPPSSFMQGNKPQRNKIQEISKYASKIIPITFGDALWYGNNMYYILSGDSIMTMFAKTLKPRLCIFVMDVDGLYQDMKTKKIISFVDSGIKSTITHNSNDVTGGMTRKIKEAKEISKNGHDVFFINGNKPQRILQVIKKRKFIGTKFGGKI